MTSEPKTLADLRKQKGLDGQLWQIDVHNAVESLLDRRIKELEEEIRKYEESVGDCPQCAVEDDGEESWTNFCAEHAYEIGWLEGAISELKRLRGDKE